MMMMSKKACEEGVDVCVCVCGIDSQRLDSTHSDSTRLGSMVMALVVWHCVQFGKHNHLPLLEGSFLAHSQKARSTQIQQCPFQMTCDGPFGWNVVL